MTSRHRIHLGDRTHSKELTGHLGKDLLALRVSKDFLNSLEEVKGQVGLRLVTFLKSLRRCLAKKVVVADREDKYRQKGKTLC